MKIPLASQRRVLLLSIIATLLVSVAVFSLRGVETPGASKPYKFWTEARASQLIFFAVLEGLYRDGVTNSDVDLIIPPGKGDQPTFDKEIFVYACPLCHPAFEAFKQYRHRELFFGMKAPKDTFGPGLEESVRTRLRSSNPEERRRAVEKLISRWVSQRLDLMRLTKDEQDEITREIEQGRKVGMGGLKQFVQSGEVSRDRTNCAICDGSFGACKSAPR